MIPHGIMRYKLKVCNTMDTSASGNTNTNLLYRAYKTRKVSATERPQTIYRAENHDENHPFVMISADTPNDGSLSFEALGLLTYVLNKPDDWVIRPTDLKKRKLGSYRRRRVLKELAAAGYIERDEVQTRLPNGRYADRLWRVRERPDVPFPPGVDNPPAGNPPASSPLAENSTLKNQGIHQEMNHDERDLFLEGIKGKYKGFEAVRSALREQLDRLGEETFKLVLKRCKKYHPSNWAYVLIALQAHELPHSPLPPSPQAAAGEGEGAPIVEEDPAFTAAMATLPEEPPDDFLPNEANFIRQTRWLEERRYAAGEIAAGREYIYQPPAADPPPKPTEQIYTGDDPDLRAGLETAYQQLSLQLDRVNFDTWVRGIRFMHFDDNVMVFGVRNSYARDMLQHRLYRNLHRVFMDCLGRQDIEMRFEVMPRQVGAKA